MTSCAESWSDDPVWCFEIGKRAPDRDYEHLIQHPEPEPPWLPSLRDHLWQVFSRVQHGVLASGQSALLYLSLPAGLAPGARTMLARFDLAEVGTVEYARMLCLVLDPARLARDGATSPVPATPALWEALGQQRPVSLAAVPELTLPEAVGEIRVVGLPASLLTLAGTPRTIEGLSPGAALDALRAALAEHPPERRMQVSFAVNVVPEDPLPHRISVIFPPLPLLPAGPATAPDPGDPEPPTETPLETSRPTTRVRWLQRLTDRRRL